MARKTKAAARRSSPKPIAPKAETATATGTGTEYQGKPVTVIRAALPADEGSVPSQDQVVIRYADGGESVVQRSEVHYL
jgi:hypothetical protein